MQRILMDLVFRAVNGYFQPESQQKDKPGAEKASPDKAKQARQMVQRVRQVMQYARFFRR